MMRVLPRRHERFSGLSCYTANLAAYLDAELSDVDGLLAGSVRLAVRTEQLRTEPLAFAHHGYPLDRLPDGTRLRYTTLPPRPAMVGIADELSRRGRVLVVAEGARLPWSPARHFGSAAPHWLLVTGRRGDSWHVLDAFAGQLPGGEQRPFAGWLSTAQLSTAMRPDDWTPVQRLRNGLAFGFPVPVPVPEGPLWLRREPDPGDDPAELPGDWLIGDAEVLPFLADRFTEDTDLAAAHADDLWTAAAHRIFRHRWLAARPDTTDERRERHDAAIDAWTRLPGALRFAIDSARRGRPRPALLRQTFGQLLERNTDDDDQALRLLPPLG